MRVSGLEINPWMIQESMEKAPEEIKHSLDFVLHTDNEHLHAEAVEGYSAIASAMKKGEGLVIEFRARKKFVE